MTTRTNTSENRKCASEGCVAPKIQVDQRYERVARVPQKIESYHVPCFVEEFGTRELYGA